MKFLVLLGLLSSFVGCGINIQDLETFSSTFNCEKEQLEMADVYFRQYFATNCSDGARPAFAQTISKGEFQSIKNILLHVNNLCSGKAAIDVFQACQTPDINGLKVPSTDPLKIALNEFQIKSQETESGDIHLYNCSLPAVKQFFMCINRKVYPAP